ncbi:TlpA family protein disulfide reductase [Actinoplanes sp. NPDC049668]|uniref:TlpA family protein disulfide reductase n=1 Tax=unclassified Actinoplanes TaxID=2626549 RepID=UPI0033BDFAE0
MIAPTVRADARAADAYRFTRFGSALLLDDLTFDRDAPGPGDRVPAFDLVTLDGGRYRDTELGPLPVLMVFGSRTCPVTESAGPVLRRLHALFGARVRFVLVNTREAHPGDVFGQPQTFAEKRVHAAELRDHHGIDFEIAVDDIDGRLHRAMSPKPNSAYLIDPSGVIRHRAHWANDEHSLRTALTDLTAGRVPARGRSRAMVGPLMRAVGHLPGIVRFAGRRVERDVWLAAPPLAVLGRMSRLFGRLPVDRRGPAAAVILALTAAAVVSTIAVLFATR